MSDVEHHAADTAFDAMTGGANPLTARATRTTLATEPAETIRVMADALERLGFDVATMLARSGLQRRDLEDPDARVQGCTVRSRLLWRVHSGSSGTRAGGA